MTVSFHYFLLQMTETESTKYTKEEFLDTKMRKLVDKKEHINFQKKSKLMERHIYWSKKYNKRGRNCHKREDINIKQDREEKYLYNDEYKYFIFIKETKQPCKN